MRRARSSWCRASRPFPTTPSTRGRRSAMRVRLKGINSKRKRLSDGRVVTYWYAWKGGPRLEGKPGSPEFIDSYNKAVSTKRQPPQGVLLSIMQGFQASDDFLSLS